MKKFLADQENDRIATVETESLQFRLQIERLLQQALASSDAGPNGPYDLRYVATGYQPLSLSSAVSKGTCWP